MFDIADELTEDCQHPCEDLNMRAEVIVAALICATIPGCGRRTDAPANRGENASSSPVSQASQAINAGPFWSRNYAKLAKSGLQKVLQARQMDELFAHVHHSVSNVNSDHVTAEWQSEVYFKDRYQLIMFAPVRLASRAHEVEEVLAPPRFQLLEIASVVGHGVTYSPRGNREFGANDWAKLYASKGDFSAIGIQLKQNQPVSGLRQFVVTLHASDHSKTDIDPPEFELAPRADTEKASSIAEVRIASTEYYPNGSLSILKTEGAKDTVIALNFNESIDVISKEQRGDRSDAPSFVSVKTTVVSKATGQRRSVAWEYSGRTNQLVVNGERCDVSPGQIAVVQITDGKPVVEIQTNTEQLLQSVRKQLGWTKRYNEKPEPSMPANE